MGAAGNALFANLPLLFAVGVAIGLAKKADGSTALAAVVGYLVFKGVGDAMSPFVLDPPAKGGTQELVNYGVLGGIVMGITAGLLWQRYYRIKLPDYLAFFGGRRFVPMITALAAIIISVLFSLVYPAFNEGLKNVSDWVADNDVIGGFVYGTLNRLLIPLGLHHILNSGPWFLFGEYKTGGVTYAGDIQRFLARRPGGRLVHDRLLPDHDVRPAGRRPGDLAGGQARAEEGRRRHHDRRRADQLPDRRDRAARVLVHVRRLAALRDPRGADRYVDRTDQRAGHPRRVRILRGPVRLPAQLEHRDQAGSLDT